MSDPQKKYELPCTEPFNGRESWSGELHTLDDTPIHDFTSADLLQVIWSYETDPTCSKGYAACICCLLDGRIISWEIYWAPAGDGFCCDAYGGDTNILCSSELLIAIQYGLSGEMQERAKRDLGLEES